MSPQILTVAPPDGVTPNTYRLTIASDYLEVFKLDPEIDLSVAGRSMLHKLPAQTPPPAETVPTLKTGDFGVFSPSEIRFMLPKGTPTPGPGRAAALPVRLVVNGAQAAPAWLEAAAPPEP